MLDLTKQEKIILTFLTLTFIAGLGIQAYKKSEQGLELKVKPNEINALRKEANRLIEQSAYININSLKIDELTRLPGVGSKIAQRIVDYHKKNGPFQSKEELLQVQGIGDKKFEQIKALIVVK